MTRSPDDPILNSLKSLHVTIAIAAALLTAYKIMAFSAVPVQRRLEKAMGDQPRLWLSDENVLELDVLAAYVQRNCSAGECCVGDCNDG